MWIILLLGWTENEFMNEFFWTLLNVGNPFRGGNCYILCYITHVCVELLSIVWVVSIRNEINRIYIIKGRLSVHYEWQNELNKAIWTVAFLVQLRISQMKRKYLHNWWSLQRFSDSNIEIKIKYQLIHICAVSTSRTYYKMHMDS